jgi:hypothetical protein
MDIHIKNLEKFAGEGVNITENPKFIAKREKQFFISLLDLLDKIDDRSNSLMEVGIDLVNYEDPFFQIIENLILKSYGSLKGGIILWWIGERKLLDADTYNMIDLDGKSTQISNVNQLYNFINKLK